MENQSPAIPKWSALLIEAVTKPGLIMKAYSAFHQYSCGNQLLALLQCQMRGLQPGPINTFPKWKDLGRFVKRGERALTLCIASAAACGPFRSAISPAATTALSMDCSRLSFTNSQALRRLPVRSCS